MTTRWFGQPIKRLEDPALLAGRGRFTDDIHLPGMLHAAFLRSPHAHALIGRIDADAARHMPGVHAVIGAADLPRELRERRIPLEVPNPAIRHPILEQTLAAEETCYVGQAIAVAVAESRQQAEDALAAVAAEFQPLPAAADCEAAFAAGAAPAHQGLADNVAARFQLAYGEVEAAFAGAAHTVAVSLRQHRGTGCPIETRAALASFDPVTESLTLWSATQAPHGVKRALVEMLDMPETRLRVIAPDVGGGFGPKLLTYPEEIAVAWCARLLRRPVKWIEDRREHLMATAQERDQVWHAALALDAQGRILGLKAHILHDTGAYLPWGTIMPYISASTLPGPYVVPALRCDVAVVFTNKVATAPMRGAGRPQAVFAMERLIDAAARRTGIDRAELRRRNLVPAAAMPYRVGLIGRDGLPLTYDSGDYPRCQAMALERGGWAEFGARKRAARAQGRLLGIGIANYVEFTGVGPFEGASARVLSSGRILLRSGAAPQGQGHRTVLAQICADEFNVDIGQIDVELGDTGGLAVGVGTFASRIAVTAGSAVRHCSQAVATRLKEFGAAHFGVPLDAVALADGAVKLTGAQGGSLSFAEIARMAGGRPGFTMPPNVEAGLEATHYFAPPAATYSNGAHLAEVEVDAETGSVRVLRYVVAHDCGRVINPLILEGQIRGGVAHGIGNALLERIVFDGEANPLTTTLGDYLLPDAASVPPIETLHMESPTPHNPLGVKGAGEGGTLPAAAAIVSAVEDALEEYGVAIAETPILPERLRALIAARAA